jgi:hypothetical protein
MERADDAIGMAKPAVAHKSKTAQNKFFFIELLENERLKIWLCTRLDAKHKPHVGELGL